MKAHTAETQATITPNKALEFLKEGNQRFVQNLKINRNLLQQVDETTDGQWPFATILSCIDSRTSAELIFDQGLGDIFSIRIAGNFVNEDILGSMEFACKVAGSKLIMVLGHSKCGALKGGLDAPKILPMGMKNLNQMIAKFDEVIKSTATADEAISSLNMELLDRITEANIFKAVSDIRSKSDVLATMEANGEILIAGGIYNVETGVVDFLPNV